MSVPDRDQVREQVNYWRRGALFTKPRRASLTLEQLTELIEVAEAWLGLEGALVIRRDENGEWPARFVTAIAYDNYTMGDRQHLKRSEIARGILDDLAVESGLALSQEGDQP